MHDAFLYFRELQLDLMQEFGKICESNDDGNNNNNNNQPFSSSNNKIYGSSNKLCTKKKFNKENSRMGLKQGTELIGCPVIKKWKHPKPKHHASSSSSSFPKKTISNQYIKPNSNLNAESKWKKISSKLLNKFSSSSILKIKHFYDASYSNEIRKLKLTNKLTGGSQKGHTILNVDGISLPPSSNMIKLPFQYENHHKKKKMKKKINLSISYNQTSSSTSRKQSSSSNSKVDYHLTMEETKALIDILLESDWLDNAKAITMEFSFFSTQFNSLTVVQLVVSFFIFFISSSSSHFFIYLFFSPILYDVSLLIIIIKYITTIYIYIGIK